MLVVARACVSCVAAAPGRDAASRTVHVHVHERRDCVRVRDWPSGRDCFAGCRAARFARGATPCRQDPRMSSTTVEKQSAGARMYYGWVVLGVAALAMVGTLPGRTQGLGLIAEPLLRDLGVSRIAFAQINLVATLVGSLGCFGVGRLIDRCGSRVVLTVVSAGLGAVVL